MKKIILVIMILGLMMGINTYATSEVETSTNITVPVPPETILTKPLFITEDTLSKLSYKFKRIWSIIIEKDLDEFKLDTSELNAFDTKSVEIFASELKDVKNKYEFKRYNIMIMKSVPEDMRDDLLKDEKTYRLYLERLKLIVDGKSNTEVEHAAEEAAQLTIDEKVNEALDKLDKLSEKLKDYIKMRKENEIASTGL